MRRACLQCLLPCKLFHFLFLLLFCRVESEMKQSSASSHSGQAVLTRAQSLRQSFAESRNSCASASAASSASGYNAAGRWGHQSVINPQKSPSPSRATANNFTNSSSSTAAGGCGGVGGGGGGNKANRPVSFSSWMTPTSPSLSPRANQSNSGSRPATPTTCSLLDYSSTDGSPTRYQQPQYHRDEPPVAASAAAGSTSTAPPWRLGTGGAETLINSKVIIK